MKRVRHEDASRHPGAIDVDADGITPLTSPMCGFDGSGVAPESIALVRPVQLSLSILAPSMANRGRAPLKRRASLVLSPLLSSPLLSPIGADAPNTPARSTTPSPSTSTLGRGPTFEWRLYVARVDLMCRMHARFASETTHDEWRAIVVASVLEAERAASRDAVLSLFRVHTAFYLPRSHLLWMSDIAIMQECTFAHACSDSVVPANEPPRCVDALVAFVQHHTLSCRRDCTHCALSCCLHEIKPIALAPPTLPDHAPQTKRPKQQDAAAVRAPRPVCWCGTTPSSSHAELWRYEIAYVVAPHFDVRRAVEIDAVHRLAAAGQR